MTRAENIVMRNSGSKFNKGLPFALLFLFVLSLFAGAFHHHADDGDHHDFPVCAAGAHYAPADLSGFSLPCQQPVTTYDPPALSILYDFTGVILLSSRGPPA